MNTSRSVKFILPLAIVCLNILVAPSAFAHGPANHGGRGEEKVTPLQKRELKDVPGKQLHMVTVEYAPGQESIPHVHPGSVFAYVVEGQVISRSADGEELEYHAGQSWYEAPGVPHLVSRNASSSRPARLVAVLITDVNQPIKREFVAGE